MNRTLNQSTVHSMIICLTELTELREYLLLSLIYFVNHNCKTNAEYIIQNDNITARALWDIEKEEEITIKYVKNYFNSNSANYLCCSCEIQLLNEWVNDAAKSNN